MIKITVTNPDGPWVYRIGSYVIDEVRAWRWINAGVADLDDVGIIDWRALSNGLDVIL